MRSLALIALLSIAQVDLRSSTAALKSPDPASRTRAACDIRELGSGAQEAIPSLLDLLADGSPVDPAVCDERTWRWTQQRDVTTTPGEQAASALVAIGTPAYEPLTRVLKGPVWIARGNAAWALGALGNHAATPLLAAVLRDTEPAVRRRGAWALGAIGDRRAVDALMNALSDQAASVREQAAWALGALGDHKAAAALSKALKDPEARVRRKAAWALGAIGG